MVSEELSGQGLEFRRLGTVFVNCLATTDGFWDTISRHLGVASMVV